MKKAYGKLVFRGIKGSFSRFCSILGIVALGSGFLSGLLASTPDMEDAADRWFDQAAVYDVNIKGTLGLTQEDLEQVLALEEVEKALPGYSLDRLMDTQTDKGVVCRVIGLFPQGEEQEMNRFQLVEGRYPENPGECVLVQRKEFAQGHSLGEVYTLSPENLEEGEEDENFAQDRFTVVGLAKSPLYLSVETERTNIGDGEIDQVLYVLPEAFSLTSYTDLYLMAAGAQEENAFSQEYKDRIQGLMDQLEVLGKERSQARLEEVRAEGYEDLEEARQEYLQERADAQQELADAKADLEEGERELSDGQADLEEGEQELSDARRELDDGWKELEEGEQELADAKAELEENKTFIDQLKEALAEGISLDESLIEEYDQAVLDVAEGEKELEKNRELLEEGKEGLREGREELSDAQSKLDAGAASLSKGRRELEKQASQAQSQYNNAKSQLESQLSQARQGLSAAQAAVDQLEGTISSLESIPEGQRTPQEQSQLDAAKSQLGTAQSGLSQAQGAVSALEGGMQQLEAQYAQGMAQLDAARQQLEAGEREISSGRASLEEGKDLLQENREAYSQGVKEFREGEQELADAKAQLEENEELIEELRKARDEGLFPLEDQIAKYDDGVREVEEGEQELADARKELEEGEQELADGLLELEDARKELSDGRKELDEGWQEYRDGYEEAQREFADAEKELADAERELEDLEEPQWEIFSREDNVGFSGYQSNVEKVSAICKVFPVFFFLVAALVALTTMTRMVEEERTQAGTLKALGYTNGAVLQYYLLYSALASVLGCIVGLSVGFRVLPLVISNTYEMMFFMPRMDLPFRWEIGLPVGLVTIACILSTTYFACAQELRERPAVLMVAKAPAMGKRIFLERITPLWRRMKFTYKVTARNLLRYKKRFFMTVIGVSGCSALLVAGFGVRDSIGDIVNLQFAQLYRYNLTLTLDGEEGWKQDRQLLELLEDREKVTAYLPFATQSGTASSLGEERDVTLQVPQDEERMGEFITLRHRKGGDLVPFGRDSVVITEKLGEELGIKEGDSLTLENQDGETCQVTVTGVTENYISAYVYLSPQVYQEGFGQSPEYLTVLAVAQGDTPQQREEISSRAMESDQVLYAMFSETIRESFQNSVGSIDYVVMVLIVAAGLLSVIVLYNLTNVNICEREKELATIKVLGFYDREVDAYIFRETVILSLIGTGVGLVLGIWLHAFVIQTVEVDAVMFGRDIYPMSFVYSAAISLAFTFLVSLLLRRRVRRIDMVESMKAGD